MSGGAWEQERPVGCVCVEKRGEKGSRVFQCPTWIQKQRTTSPQEVSCGAPSPSQVQCFQLMGTVTVPLCRHYWKKPAGGTGPIKGPLRIQDTWPALPDVIDAAFQDKLTKKLFFFSGEWCWQGSLSPPWPLEASPRHFRVLVPWGGGRPSG